MVDTMAAAVTGEPNEAVMEGGTTGVVRAREGTSTGYSPDMKKQQVQQSSRLKAPAISVEEDRMRLSEGSIGSQLSPAGSELGDYDEDWSGIDSPSSSQASTMIGDSPDTLKQQVIDDEVQTEETSSLLFEQIKDPCYVVASAITHLRAAHVQGSQWAAGELRVLKSVCPALLLYNTPDAIFPDGGKLPSLEPMPDSGPAVLTALDPMSLLSGKASKTLVDYEQAWKEWQSDPRTRSKTY